eukprot:CAMPEP_0179479650 /NCGR_PEP_ID=MMETSP0799-20121207/57840_1 /TAXON_ID=46947 /ORGANISM="Geminigera cryophila, Strain CCMP2564" /LENGTH=444 /DNA_ID=CAMNT_0021291393 /DNA_START=168 /DNA_END=1500 /DNA_ORIENTATION=-
MGKNGNKTIVETSPPTQARSVLGGRSSESAANNKAFSESLANDEVVQQPRLNKLLKVVASGSNMEAMCAPLEQCMAGVPKLKRLWKARNSLSSKLSERRAKLKREGIITDVAVVSDSSTDDDDDEESELLVWCNGEKKAIVRDKIFSRRRSNVRVAHAALALSAAKKFGRSLSRSGGRPSEVSQPRPRSRLTENMADPFQLWQAGENFLKLQKLGEKRPTLRCAEYPHLSKSISIPCKMPAPFGTGGKQKSMPTTLCVRPDAASPAHAGLELSMSTQSLKNLFKNVSASLYEVDDDHDFTNDASRTLPKVSPINPLPSAAKRLLPSTAHLAPKTCKRVPVTSSGVQVGAPVPSEVEEPGGERGNRGEEGGGESRSTGHWLQWSPHSMSDPLPSESASPDKNPPHQNGLFGGALDAYPPNIPEILMSTTQPCNPFESALLDSLRV